MNQPNAFHILWALVLLIVFWGPAIGIFIIGCYGLFAGRIRLTPNTTLHGRAARITGVAAIVGSFFCTPPALFSIVWSLMGDGYGGGRGARVVATDAGPPPPAPPAAPALPEARSGGRAGQSPATTPAMTRPPVAVAAVAPVVPSPDPLPGTGTLEAQSMARLQRIAEAMLAYHQQHGRFPPAVRYDSRGLPQWSWRVELLPLLGFQSLYDEFQHDEPWNSRHNRDVAARIPDVYQTPGNARGTMTCYLVPTGPGTIFGQGEGAAAAITDGASNAILLVEADAQRAVSWTQPQDMALSPSRPTAGLGTMRGGRFLAAMADGSLRALPTSTDSGALRALFIPGASDMARAATPASQHAAGERAAGERADADRIAYARHLLAAGKAADARATLQAAAVSQGHEEVLATLRWCEAIKRPALMIRIGMVIQARMPPVQLVGPGAPSSAARPQPSPQLQFWHGTVGQPLITELEAKFARGDFGEWYIDAIRDASASAPATVRRPPAHQAAATAPPPIAGGGLESLGLLDESVLWSTAERRRLDFLIVAHVAVNRAAAGQRDAESGLILRILDVAGRRKIYESEMLSSTRVVGAMRVGGSGTDPAGDAVRRIVQFIDEEIALTPIPPIVPVVAERRAESLAARSYENPLPALVELRYYQWKQLLSPERLNECYTRILGPEVGPAVARGERDLSVDPARKSP